MDQVQHFTAQKVYPNLMPKACVIQCYRNGNKSGVIRDELIIFYDMVQHGLLKVGHGYKYQ